MNRILRSLIAALGLAIVTPAQAETFTFYQGGFAEAAFVSGTFEAEDLGMDGQIGPGEYTAFSATFSGNSVVAAFAMDFANLFGLVYDLDGDIGDGTGGAIEGIGWDDGVHRYIVGPGPFNLCDGFDDCGLVELFAGGSTTTLELVQVPEPAAALLLAGGVIVLAGIRHR